MKCKLKEEKLHVRAFMSSCACSCQFCCLDKVGQSAITFEDYEFVLRKYAKEIESTDMELKSFLYNRPDERFVGRQMKLYKDLNMEPDEYSRLDMNGIPIMDEEKLKNWFMLLKKAGVSYSMYSWFGQEKKHDAFVHKKGYYSFLKECITKSKENGIGVKNKIFLRKSILHEVDQLADELAVESEFLQCVFMEYAGGAIGLEDEFITSDDLSELSPKIYDLIEKPYLSKFKTEREWVKLALEGKYPEFRLVDYILILDPNNIDYYKTTDLEEVLMNFRKMNCEMQELVGNLSELAERFGNRESLILYECRDVLRKWMNSMLMEKHQKYEDYFGPDKTCVEWKAYKKMHE